MTLKFCGASVQKFGGSLGWNEQTSTFQCTVLEDIDDGDYFLPPPVGTPIYFQYGSFYFRGLLQSWSEKRSTQGQMFEVRGVDPRQILEGAVIITAAYRGATPVSNVINAFGWAEEKYGFGGSLSNDQGMPYNRVYEAVVNSANVLTGTYGAALNYRGVFYSLDLSELPTPPSFYRVPAPSIGLLEFISMVCEDGACDYFVELVPGTFTIKVRTKSRYTQFPLGTVTALTQQGYGVDLMESSSGLEARNETTSVFLLGGERKELLLRPQESINTFWGFDFNGNPILGFGIGAAHKANLNASPISHIVGDTSYLCTVLEMRCALAGYESWAAYMLKEKPTLAATLNMPIGANAPYEVAMDYINTSLNQMANSNFGYVGKENFYSNQLFSFVENYARDYMGKKYIVSLPMALKAIESETGRVVTSYEPTDAGYAPEGSAPLGLPLLQEDQFKTQDGRFEAFVLFRNLVNADLSRLADDAVITPDGVYVKVQVDQTLVGTPGPACIITVSNPIYRQGDGMGDIAAAAGLLGLTNEEILILQANIAAGTLPVKVHPEAINPYSAAIPLKSNISTYGPWYIQGAPGKVRFEQDQGLTPWNYGGVEYMNLAALAKVTQAISQLQVVEVGNARLAGEPRYALGDSLQVLGTNITGIDVEYSEGGVSANYSLTTFTKPRQGYFDKDNAKRLERIGRQNAEFRKGLRAAVNKTIAERNVINGAYSWLARMGGSMTRESPHTTLISTIKTMKDGTKRVFTSTGTLQEIVAGCGGHIPDVWKKMSVMSLDGLLTPFCLKPGYGLPSVTTPVNNSPDVLNSTNLNPYINSKINILASGQNYNDINTFKRKPDQDMRPIGLTGPVWITGWSLGVGNKNDPLTWKTGPLDPVWDEGRGVWSVHDIKTGITDAEIPCLASASVSLTAKGVRTGAKINVTNYFNTTVNPGVKIFIGYNAEDGQYYVISADM